MTTTLLARIVREKRLALGIIAVALVAIVAVSALLVYPMYVQAQAGAELATAAQQELRAAEKDFASANGIVTGRTKAVDDLRTFYAKVLPADLAAARRATYLKLSEMARESGLQTQRRVEEVQEPKRQDKDGSTLTRFNITMVLKGDYVSIREFLRAIEAADAFIVIDNVGLTEGNEPNGPLVLTVELSTYYREVAHGA